MSAARSVESLLRPADRLRGAVLRVAAPWLRPWLLDVEARVTALGCALVAVALALAATEPLWLLVLGPLVWGIPHVVADLRYLVVRAGLHRRPGLWVGVGLPLAASALGGGLCVGLLACAGAAVVARGGARRRVLALVATVLVAALAWRAGRVASVLFAQAHNVVALGWWWAWRRRVGDGHWRVILVFVVGAAVLFGGLADPVLAWTRGSVAPRTGLDPAVLAYALSPVEDPSWASRWVGFYAFAQAVHYGVWLRLVPEEDRARPTPRSWTQAFRALRADLGDVVLTLVAASMALLAARACEGLAAARDEYLRFAGFHGYLELAVATLCWTEARSIRCRCPREATV